VTPANRSDTGEFERLVLEADVPCAISLISAPQDGQIGTPFGAERRW
jgi:hypothetical protein